MRRAGITKAGNALARRALIEGAWTYRMQPRVSRKLHDRIEALPQSVRDIAWKAQVRLCARYRRLAAAGKPKDVVTTAIARGDARIRLGDRSERNDSRHSLIGNDLFKVLTIVSVVGVPPTLLAGIWGMNFKNMPQLNWAWAYPLSWAAILLSAILPLIWFKRSGWF